MKLLHIHYNFPPIKAVGSIRNYELAKAIGVSNDLFVITRTNAKGANIFANNKAFRVYFAACIDYKTFSFKKGDGKSRRLVVRNAFKHQLKKQIKRLVLTFPFLLLLDRGGIIYILHAFIIARRLVRKYEIEVIYSSYQPYADHIIAFLIKKSNPRIRWIADMRDQPVDTYRNNVLWPKWQDRFNQILLGAADGLTTVSEGVKQQLLKYHSHISVINNGIDPDRVSNCDLSLPPRFRISYTGALYQGDRDPSLLLEVLSKLVESGSIALEDLEIIYAGSDEKIWNNFMEDYPTLSHSYNSLGLISRHEVLEVQSGSVLNVLLTWADEETKGILTGKVYEYIASGRPVLAIIKGVNDPELVQLIETTKIGIVVANNRKDAPAILHDFLLKIYQKWQAGSPLGFGLENGQLKHLFWPELANRLIEKMNNPRS